MKQLHAIPYLTFVAAILSVLLYSWFAFVHIFGTGKPATKALVIYGAATILLAFANLAFASYEPTKLNKPSMLPLIVSIGSLLPLIVVAGFIIVVGIQFVFG